VDACPLAFLSFNDAAVRVLRRSTKVGFGLLPIQIRRSETGMVGLPGQRLRRLPKVDQ
jgi:hypothetical protein